MAIPPKALKESQLRYLTAGNAVDDGSHQTFRVSFVEGGTLKKAFLKKLEPKNHYPELLGKISVATSLFKRLFQGKRSAEERLVFDDKEKLIGTLSLDIENFKSFSFASEPVPSDTGIKEQVIPSTKTLIEHNAMETMVGRWLFDDDDAHPHNWGLAGDIDFDMFFYWFTIGMKGARPIIGTPKKSISLTVGDWEAFPNVKSKPYHWPTYQYPGQETLPSVVPGPILARALPKTYADPTQFEQLAREPKAQEQKFAAALKALLTFQPDVTRKRLTELFGDMPLNYTSLDETDVSLRVAYEREYPGLCNETTNTKPFIDFMMDMYQKHYDNLYRVVVFYMGCENNGHGVPLKSTYSTLYHKPSFYKNIEEWVKTQNGTIHSKDDIGLKYDLPELQKRYHQIWRDAYTPTLKELLHSCYQLTNKVLFQVSSRVEVKEVEGKKVTDDSLTTAWELIGTVPDLSKDIIEPLIVVDKDSKFRDGLLLLVEFTKSFHAISKAYYEKERKDLTEEDNLSFSTKLKELYNKYNLPLRKNLLHTTTHATEFNRIAFLLKQFTEQVDFQLHLTTTDEQMKDTMTTIVVKEVLPHTHEEVISQLTDSLFLWAKGLTSEQFGLYINNIIDTHYAPFSETVTKRHRTKPVKDYLLASKNDSGDNRLAYIFSSGHEDTGALNTFLVQHLTPLMLQTYPLLSISNAVREGTFNRDVLIFTKASVTFSKQDMRFTHLYSAEGIRLFYKTMYDWAESLSPTEFKGMINAALTKYEKGLWGWNASRRSEVDGYYKTSTNHAQILALIFLNGADTSTLNDYLFDKIIETMKSAINISVEKQQLPGCKLIMQFNPDEHKAIYYERLKTNAVAPSHRVGPSTSSSSSSSVVMH